MKRVFPYYELTASIRFGDKAWPEYPHVYLANMEMSEDSIHAFLRLYGRLFEEREPVSPLPKTDAAVWSPVIRKGQKEPMSIQAVAAAQRVLRGAWRNEPDWFAAIAGHDPEQDAFIYKPMQPELSVTDTGIELITPDVWTFARLGFLRDHALVKRKSVRTLTAQVRMARCTFCKRAGSRVAPSPAAPCASMSCAFVRNQKPSPRPKLARLRGIKDEKRH